ncbi:hypothetical protein DFR24_1466 [Panacagrimonas perspica]|uniref:Uncharacterized protein n=2 Tax=Panacagrimonas perspica TaxID=381431 RepID=A0A4R7PDB8_9GAMM|nr:hypothetical protein DFR24_1466 [Panacagrimonas perspica]
MPTVPGYPRVSRFFKMAALTTTLATSACMPFGTRLLQDDQVDYARALVFAQKRQTLANIVGLRYAEPAVVLPVSQVIAAYSLDGSANAAAALSTQNNAPTTGSIGGGIGYATRPTFTFTPLTGEDFANAYSRPLAPSLVLPLVQSGVPIDVLLRLAVQSIGSLQNSAALSGANNAGSHGFFELLQALRRLQLGGFVAMRLEGSPQGNRIFMSIEVPAQASDDDRADAARVRELLTVPAGTTDIEVLYGVADESGSRVGIVTRSVIGMLTEVGAQIQVPPEDVASGATLATVGFLDIERRPVIIVHTGGKMPDNAYASIKHQRRDYWIEQTDFDSKFAFSVVQTLIALAQAGRSQPIPVVTIPAGG